MFFRRILERKDNNGGSGPLPMTTSGYNSASVASVNSSAVSEVKDSNNNTNSSSSSTSLKMQRRSEAPPIGAVQLTPLWEHILRTRRLPETVGVAAMYGEFHERLQDPEWQVRQHALRVLVDVLVVMQDEADGYMDQQQIVGLLVENLGHQAPTVRKGALDCLRVYLAETSVPEPVMVRILDAGLAKSDVAGRLSCGVLLSLPALLQSILHTPRRHRIAQLILERVVQHLDQLAQQEIALKVLTKIRELLGVHEFEDCMNDLTRSDALSKFYQLCQVYGVTEKPKRVGEVKTGAWRALPRDESWRNVQKLDNCPDKGKVIMETEIKINEDTVTMRILEADTETEESDSPTRLFSKDSESAELVCRPLLASAKSHHELNVVSAGIVQVISDSELDEPTRATTKPESFSEPSTPSRGLKRVTFGGEIVKMRTPDSDAASSSTTNEANRNAQAQRNQGATILALDLASPTLEEPEAPAVSVLSPSVESPESKTTALVVEIPSDNTQPLPAPGRPFSSQSPRRPSIAASDQSSEISPRKRSDSEPKAEALGKLMPSPRSPVFLRSRSTSPTVSPKVPHKQIEVLHNLQQRDPSPRSVAREEASPESPSPNLLRRTRSASIVSAESPATPKSWEDLDIVNYKTLMDLRSGDWRNRLQGIAHLELALSSSSNLALVQPYLDSLLRTLLSSERRFEVAELKRELLVNLISRLPLDNLEERTPQILTGLCRQGNAGANRVCKALMQRLPAGTIVAKLTAPDFLHAKSSKFRDHALQMSIFALMTFPGTCFDIHLLTAQAVYSLLNRKRRVRQSALEVLAVLADISSVKEVLAIVAEVAVTVEQGPQVLEAARARLSRLQLPIVTPDSAVLFTFNLSDQPGGRRSGADVDWVNQGEGSASPNTIKRRRMRVASRQRGDVPEETQVMGTKDTFHSCNQVNENLQRHSFHSPPETLDMTSPTSDFSQRLSFGAKPSNGGVSGYMDRRLVVKACSDTSMDGRSSDSTNTTCSSGSASGTFVQLATRAGHFAGLNSRFPAMYQHTDFVNNFMRSYPMGAASFAKINYVIAKPMQSVMRKKMQRQGSFTKPNAYELVPGRIFCYQASLSLALTMDSPAKAFATAAVTPALAEGSPLSVKSTSYSQMSTASAKSSGSHVDTNRPTDQPELLSLERNPGEAFGELVIDDMEDDKEEAALEVEHPATDLSLKRNGSVNSLHSKTESIKTQLEDTTPQLSRAQSVKSLPIEEDIVDEGSNSFVVVEEVQHDLQAAPAEVLPLELPAMPPMVATCSTPMAIRSRSISLDSLYVGPRPGSKQGSMTSTSTTENTSQSGSQLVSVLTTSAAKVVPVVEHTPMKKAKTAYFLRNQRRVSPVKQTIKMSQPELFPQNMARFDKPREALLKTFDQLDSSNWETNMTGLKSMVRLIRYHSETLDTQMHMSCIQLTRTVRNLRSQVARAACQAAAELFSMKSASLQQECDDLVCALLHRTADTNRFLRSDAARALESMVDHSQPPKVLNILANKGAVHQNALVRTTTAKLLYRLVERLGSERIYTMGRDNRDKFFLVGANLLLEGSLETRSYAKSLFRVLSEHNSYQRLLLEVIPPRTYRNVEKTLRSLHR
ncbi:hypothetical protein KR018_001736 [Drosophila ironensis]|nr:hypothetical protein KR018_001736 [Drosophila ironensis]